MTGTADPPVGFRRHLRAVVAPGAATYLLSARGTTVLEGQFIAALAPLLDGTRTVPAVLREAAPQVPAAVSGRLLGALARAKLVAYHRPSAAADAAAEAYWELAGLDGARVADALAGTAVAVTALGCVDAGQVADACRESGLSVAGPATGEPGLSLVVCDDYLDPRLSEVDAVHRTAGRPWLLAKPSGFETWVGPVFGLAGGACWSCLAHRIRGHRRAERPARRALGVDGSVPRPEASLASSRALGVRLAAIEAAKWLAGVRHPGQRAVTTMDTLAGLSARHPVAHRPQCPACGDPGLVARQGWRPVVLQSRPKAGGAGAAHRALPPEQVLARHRDLISPVTGVLAGVHRDTRLPDGLHCYRSGQNLAMPAGDLGWVRAGLRCLSGGKGVTPLEAEVGALCEAVERYCGTRQGDEPTVRDSLAGLGEVAIHPNACQLFADDQFRQRDRWNATHSVLHQVCAPFDARAVTDWTPLWSISTRRHRLLPTSMLYFSPHRAGEPGDLWADSNGNASGSSLEDAVLHGFLELVERDAVAQWWYNRTRHPAVDLDAFDEPWLAELRMAYQRLHREVWALDLTADFGIPVVGALSRRVDRPVEDILLGFGAHVDPRLALRRAMTEMNQSLPAVLEVAPGGSGYAVSDLEPLRWWTTATVRNQPYLRPDREIGNRTPAEFAYRPRADLRGDLAEIDRLVREHGLELLVLDQTRPDVGMPVVKVVVPGMRHFWARFAPGRLFDVPVRLGRLPRATRREELNPIPLFL